MPVAQNTLWEMKTTSDWKILGQRRMMRLHVNQKLERFEADSIETETSSAVHEDFSTALSCHDAWKALGRRKTYRTPPSSTSTTPKNDRASDLVSVFAAMAARTIDSDEIADSDGQAVTASGNPHITTIFFLDEMRQFR
jgi:hypothetical protein